MAVLAGNKHQPGSLLGSELGSLGVVGFLVFDSETVTEVLLQVDTLHFACSISLIHIVKGHVPWS